VLDSRLLVLVTKQRWRNWQTHQAQTLGTHEA
jgi:hypothetical protein